VLLSGVATALWETTWESVGGVWLLAVCSVCAGGDTASPSARTSSMPPVSLSRLDTAPREVLQTHSHGGGVAATMQQIVPRSRCVLCARHTKNYANIRINM